MPRLSLTARLTLLFTTASGAVLLLLGWVVLGAIERHFDDLDRSELTGKLQHAEHIIGAARTPQDLAGMVGQLREAFSGHHDLAMAVRGPDQALLFATPGVVFPDSVATRGPDRAAAPLQKWTAEGRRFHGLEWGMPMAPVAQGDVRVFFAIDSAHHDDFMHDFRRTLWLFVACAALMVTYYVCYRAIGTGHWAYLAAILAAGLCGTAVLIHTAGVRADVVGVVTAILTVLLCGAVPRFTARLEPFETPVAAADVERSADWSLDNPFPATQTPQPAADVNSGTNMPTAEQVWARVRSVSLTRSALLLGFAVTAVAANTMLLRDDRVLRWPVFTFTLTSAVVLGLRSRSFRPWWERAALVAPAITLGVTACVLSQTGRFPLPLTAVVILLATAVTAVMIGLAARPAPGPNTRRTKVLDYLDYLTVGALIPVALWVLGAYEILGPWSW